MAKLLANSLESKASKQQAHNDNASYAPAHPDSMDLFFRQIAAIPALKLEEETELCRKLDCKRKALVKADKKSGSGKEQLHEGNEPDSEMAVVRKELEEVEKELFLRNLRLVTKIARRYTNKGLDLMDLLQEGTIGLQGAVKGFDPERGTRFYNYATKWIHSAIKAAITEKSRTIRLPIHVYKQLFAVRRACAQLYMENGQIPDYNPKPEEIEKRTGLSVEKIMNVKELPLAFVSFDAPVSSENDNPRHLVVADDRTPATELENNESFSRNLVGELLGVLNPRERLVIKQRFGLNDDESVMMLKEIGEQMKVTKERIRQIEAEALKKLACEAQRIAPPDES